MARVPPRSTPPPPREDSDYGIEPTIVSTRDELNLAGASPDQTIVSTPGRRRTAEERRPPRSGSRPTPPAPPGSGWTTSQIAIVAALVLLLVAGAVLVAMLLSSTQGTTGGLLLSVIKPTNGTVVGHGINCGTQGTQCSVELARETPVTLRLVPDEGFASGGYTQDCPATGQFLITAPRTCGAIFVRAGVPITTGRTHTLTILPTDGGVVRIGSAECRRTSGDCAVQLREGEVADLEALADKGYTFDRFTGKCDVEGRVTMSEPQTCGATFVSRSADAPPGPPQPPLPPRPPVRDGPQSARDKTVDKPTASPVGAVATADSGNTKTPDTLPVPPSPGGGTANSTPVSPVSNPAPPPPPLVESDEEQSKKEIAAVIESYRKANEALDFPAVRRVYPTAPEGIADQWRRFVKTQKLEKSGEPEIKLDLPAGTATAVATWNRTSVSTLGQKQQGPRKVTFQLHRKTANNNWVIGLAKFE